MLYFTLVDSSEGSRDTIPTDSMTKGNIFER